MRHFKLTLCAGLASLALIPAVAMAQSAAPSGEPASAPSGKLDEVVVTAQKRSENLQKVPIAVAAFSANALNSLGSTNTKDLQTLVPGLVFTQNQNAGNPYLRGVGQNNGTIGQESPIAVYVDGVYLAQAGSYVMDFNNIQQVEVLKGPQGTLFGRNATGGVIQINTKDPSLRSTALDVDVGYGNYDTYSGHLYASTPVTANLGTSIAVMGQDESGGFGYDVFTKKKIFQAQEFGIQNKWFWAPTTTDTVTVNLLAVHNRAWTGPTTGVYPGSLAENHVTRFISDWVVADGVDSPARLWQSLESIKYTHDFGWARFTNIVAGHQYQEHISLVQNGIPLGTGQMTGTFFHDSAETLTEEAQLASPAGQDFQWITGVFYMHDTTDVHRSAYKDLNMVAGGTNFDQITQSYAGFAQATKTILPATRLTAGIRYTHDEKDTKGSVLNAAGGVSQTMAQIAALGGWQTSRQWAQPTYRLSLDHDFTRDILGYVSYNTGFKSGIYNPSSPANPPANPEEVKAIEAGLKTEWLDHTLRVNVSAFNYDYNNIQLRASVPPSVTPLTTNAGRSKVNGLDFDVQWAPMSGLTISGGGEFLDAKYTSYPTGTCSVMLPTGGTTSTICNLSGHRMIRSPDFTGNIGVQYLIPLDHNRGDIKLSANDQYNSGFTWDPDSRLVMKAFHMLSLSATWSLPGGRYYATIWGKNLDNVDLYSTATATTTDQYAPGTPRTYGVTIGAHF